MKKMRKKSMVDTPNSDNGYKILDDIKTDNILKQVLLRVREQLLPGDAYTYKKLIAKLGLTPKTSNSKKSQLKQLSRLFNYEFDNSYYIITEIYSEIQPKVPRKLRSDSVYSIRLQKSLLKYLLNNSDGTGYIRHTYKYWWTLLGMVNGNYIKYFSKSRREELSKISNGVATVNDIDLFYRIIGNRFSSIFSKIISKLEDRMLIMTEYVYLIMYEGCDYYKEANDKEKKQILESKKAVASNMGFKSEVQIRFNPSIQNEYYANLSEYQYEHYNMQRVYKELKIIHSKKFLQIGIQEIENELSSVLNGDCNTVFMKAGILAINNVYEKNKLRYPNGKDVEDEILALYGMTKNDIRINDVIYYNFNDSQKYLLNKLVLLQGSTNEQYKYR